MTYPSIGDAEASIRNHQLLALKFKAGTTSHADPYTLAGQVDTINTAVDYDEYNGDPEDLYYPLDLSNSGFLSDISWENESTHPSTSSSGGGITYIPLHWAGSAYENDVHYLDADQNPAGVIAFGTARMRKATDSEGIGQGSNPEDHDRYGS